MRCALGASTLRSSESSPNRNCVRFEPIPPGTSPARAPAQSSAHWIGYAVSNRGAPLTSRSSTPAPVRTQICSNACKPGMTRWPRGSTRMAKVRERAGSAPRNGCCSWAASRSWSLPLRYISRFSYFWFRSEGRCRFCCGPARIERGGAWARGAGSSRFGSRSPRSGPRTRCGRGNLRPATKMTRQKRPVCPPISKPLGPICAKRSRRPESPAMVPMKRRKRGCSLRCRLQIASDRPRIVGARTDNEPDNDHTNTPSTTQIGRLFHLSFAPASTWPEAARAACTLALGLKSRCTILPAQSHVVPTFRGQLRKINGLASF